MQNKFLDKDFGNNQTREKQLRKHFGIEEIQPKCPIVPKCREL